MQEMLRIQERDRSEAMERQFSEARRQVESLQQEKAQLQTEQVRSSCTIAVLLSVQLKYPSEGWFI